MAARRQDEHTVACVLNMCTYEASGKGYATNIAGGPIRSRYICISHLCAHSGTPSVVVADDKYVVKWKAAISGCHVFDGSLDLPSTMSALIVPSKLHNTFAHASLLQCARVIYDGVGGPLRWHTPCFVSNTCIPNTDARIRAQHAWIIIRSHEDRGQATYHGVAAFAPPENEALKASDSDVPNH